MTNIKKGDQYACERGCGTFTVDEFFLCPKCLQVVPSNLEHTLNNIKPIIHRILTRLQIRIQKIEKEDPQKYYEFILCDRLRTLIIQLFYNLTLQQEGMTPQEIDESLDQQTAEIKYLAEFFQKMQKLTGIGFPLTIKSRDSYLKNYEAYMTKTFHGECIFQIDSYFRLLNNDYEIAKDNNEKLERITSKILKETIKQLDCCFDKLKNPISALAEIRNTYHNNDIPDNNLRFTINGKHVFKLEKGKPHHFMTLFHVLYLLEKSLPILENIMDNKNKL